MTNSIAIKVSDLTMGFFGISILEHITFDVSYGEIFVILGGSGCGKSTLLRHMIGLQTPMHGHVYLEGADITAASRTEKLAILQKIGVMFQSGALFGSMTLLENVSLPLEEFTDLPQDAIEMIAMNKLNLVGLGAGAHLVPSEISGGMQKRAAIARAMVLDPKIIFLDEPSAGLDPITSSEIDQLIVNLRNSLGITFVIVSHELRSIFAIADRIIMLDKKSKSIIAEGDPHELRHKSQNVNVKHFLGIGGESERIH